MYTNWNFLICIWRTIYSSNTIFNICSSVEIIFFWDFGQQNEVIHTLYIWWSSSIGLSPAIRDMEVMHLEKREDHLGRVIRMPPHCGASIGPLYFNQTPAKVDSHQTSSYLALLAGPGSLCIGVKLFLKSLSFFVCTCRFNSIFMPISSLFFITPPQSVFKMTSKTDTKYAVTPLLFFI